MRTLLTLFICIPLLFAVAQDSQSAQQEPDSQGDERIIRIESEGAVLAGNLRYGPHEYSHSEPEGIVATVSNLTIFSSEARLQVPPEEQGETLLAQAEGRREAYFEGGVRVTRGRLEATGPRLGYSEATGLGLLEGGADIRVEPAEEGDDPVAITAAEVEFDVDTDRSISRGDVELESGNQRAQSDELLFEEERSLGCLYADSGQITLTRLDADGDELLITADEACVLTDDERLHARGNVTVIDGSITSTGEEVFFDDARSLAEIIGSPARSVDEDSGSSLESDRILHDIEFDYFEAIDATVPSDFDPADFEPTASAE